VVSVTQLTDDGKPKQGGVSDGSQIYRYFGDTA
jgi:hypothetical protein